MSELRRIEDYRQQPEAEQKPKKTISTTSWKERVTVFAKSVEIVVSLAALIVGCWALWTSIQQSDYALRAAKAQALSAGLQAFSEAEKDNPVGGNCVAFMLDAGLEPKIKAAQPVRVPNWANTKPRSAWNCMASAIVTHPNREFESHCSMIGVTFDKGCKEKFDGFSDQELRLFFDKIESLPYEWYRQVQIQAAKQLNAAADLYAVLSVSEPKGEWSSQVCLQLFYSDAAIKLKKKFDKMPDRTETDGLVPPAGCSAKSKE